MVLGGYFLTYCELDLDTRSSQQVAKTLGVKGLSRFASEEEVEFALDARQVKLQDPIEYRRNGDVILTTPGRVIFNEEVQRALAECSAARTATNPRS